MLEQPARSADQNIAAADSRPLELQILPANDKTRTEVVLSADRPEHLKYLVGQLSSGSDHHAPHTVRVAPLGAVEFLQQRHQECQSLAGASLGGP